MAKEGIDVGDVEPDAGFVGQPPAKVRVGKQKREPIGEPDSLSARQMVKARVLADRLFDRRENLRKQLGDPLKSAKLSSKERKTQYKELIASREMLFNSLAGAAIVGRDGKLRISTAMVDALVELSGATRS